MITVECLVDSIPVRARNQGKRPTCLAFAVTDINRQFASGDLGPEYFYQATVQRIPGWKAGDGVQISAAIDASKFGHPLESEFPYQLDEPLIPFTTLPTSLQMYGRPITFFQSDLGSLISTMRAGTPMGLVLGLTLEFYNPVCGRIPFNAITIPGTMIHAVVAVGLGQDASGEYWFYIRNSWGTSWGEDGHAWIPAAYIVAHAACAFGV